MTLRNDVYVKFNVQPEYSFTVVFFFPWAYIQCSTGVAGINSRGSQGKMIKYPNVQGQQEVISRSVRANSARIRPSSNCHHEVINQKGVRDFNGNPSNNPPPADRFSAIDSGSPDPVTPNRASGSSPAAVRSFLTIQMICGQYWLVRVLR